MWGSDWFMMAGRTKELFRVAVKSWIIYFATPIIIAPTVVHVPVLRIWFITQKSDYTWHFTSCYSSWLLHNSSGASWPPVPGRERPSTNTLVFNWASKVHSTCFPKHATLSRSCTNVEWQHARPYSVDSWICSLFPPWYPQFQVKSQEDWHEARRTWLH